MQNVVITVTGKKLVIEVDLSKRLGPSGSGKTTIIATTSGNVPVDGHPGVSLGLNVYEKK